MWWFLLFGCEGVTNLCDATGLCYEEQVEPSEDVIYAGTVSQGPVAEGVPLVEEGSLSFTDPATGDLLAEGIQPYRSDPGFWEAVLPRKAEFQLRIESPEAYPTVWRGRAPPQQGWWYTGAIFSWPHSVWDSFSDELEDQGMGPFPDLQAEERVALWGAPVDEELQVLPLGPGRVRDHEERERNRAAAAPTAQRSWQGWDITATQQASSGAGRSPESPALV